MGLGEIGIVVQLFLFAAVMYGVFVGLSSYFSAREDIEKLRETMGSAGFDDVAIGMEDRTLTLVRNAGTIFALLIGMVLFHPIIAILFAGGAYLGPMILIKRKREKRTRRVEQQLVEALELLGNSLKSGLTLQQASALVVQEFPAPISQEFSVVLAETRLGVEFTDALQNMATRLRSNIVQILASGVAVTKKCGGDLTVIFQNIAQVIREQANIEGKLFAVTAQGRFQGLVLGLMPFILVVVLYFVDPAHVETLFGYKIGLYAFTLVVVMVIAAQLWIRKLLDIDV